MNIHPAPQGSAAWLQARIGLVTASRIKDVLAVLTRASKNGKAGEPAAARIAYRAELVAERLSGRSEDHYVSPEMDHGTEYEPIARSAYEIATGTMVDTVGLVYHPTMPFSGASADGLVDDEGAVEIKAPKTTTHLRWIQAGIVPEEHQDQCLWVMACCERQYLDFISYDPRLPDGLKIFIVRMERDEERIKMIEQEVASFNAEVEAACNALRSRVRTSPPAPIDTRSDFDQLIAMIDREELVP